MHASPIPYTPAVPNLARIVSGSLNIIFTNFKQKLKVASFHENYFFLAFHQFYPGNLIATTLLFKKINKMELQSLDAATPPPPEYPMNTYCNFL